MRVIVCTAADADSPGLIVNTDEWPYCPFCGEPFADHAEAELKILGEQPQESG